MDIKAFEYVSAIVKYGNLSRASKELFISQPALSQYISKLEHSLGVQLFLREGHRLRLTPAGEIFLQDGQKILNIYSNMFHRLSDADNGPIVNIHLGISQFYGRFYLPYILPAFLKSHPNVRFSITEALTDTLEDMVLEGKLDVCMIPMYLLNDKLEYHTLYREEIMLAVPARSPVNNLAVDTPAGKAIHLEDLRSENFIMLSRAQKFSDMAVKLCSEKGFLPNVICEVLNWDTLNLLVQQGLGIGFVTSLISSAPQSADSPCYYRIVSSGETSRPYGIASSKLHATPLVTEFIEYVRNLAEQKLIPNVSPLLP